MYRNTIVVIISLWCVSCSEAVVTERPYPRVSKLEITNVINSGASFKAEVTYSSVPIIDHGFIWTLGGFPTLTNGEKVSLGAKAGIGVFVHTVNGLQVGKKYTMCAYVRSSQETVYGDVVDFVSK
jgi:hypothetical protein